MTAASLALWLLAPDGSLARVDGIVLCVAGVAYTPVSSGRAARSRRRFLRARGIAILVAPTELAIPPEVVAADLLLLAVVAVITVPVLLSGQRMTRAEGGAFVAAYAGYLLWLILH
jgi:hypothetical protein